MTEACHVCKQAPAVGDQAYLTQQAFVVMSW